MNEQFDATRKPMFWQLSICNKQTSVAADSYWIYIVPGTYCCLFNENLIFIFFELNLYKLLLWLWLW